MINDKLLIIKNIFDEGVQLNSSGERHCFMQMGRQSQHYFIKFLGGAICRARRDWQVSRLSIRAKREIAESFNFNKMKDEQNEILMTPLGQIAADAGIRYPFRFINNKNIWGKGGISASKA